MSEYSGNEAIVNTDYGNLNRKNIVLEQYKVDGSTEIAKDFGALNEYQLLFTPTNPIPRLGWVVIEYPDNVLPVSDQSP